VGHQRLEDGGLDRLPLGGGLDHEVAGAKVGQGSRGGDAAQGLGHGLGRHGAAADLPVEVRPMAPGAAAARRRWCR
jgi:hypothetical protein